MGGRGASSGISDKGKPYGEEYETLKSDGNIKYVRYKDSKSAKTPQETMTAGRVYVTINAKNIPTAVTYYDRAGKRVKTIDLTHFHDGIKPHTHHGYVHNEYDGRKGAAKLTSEERKMVERILKKWYNKS